MWATAGPVLQEAGGIGADDRVKGRVVPAAVAAVAASPGCARAVLSSSEAARVAVAENNNIGLENIIRLNVLE